MILHWETIKKESPLTIQIIEKMTGYAYDNVYGTLINKDKRQLGYAQLVGFMDQHGWYLTVYPTQYPHWNGVISDTQDGQVFNMPTQFAEVFSRSHAESMLAGIAIQLFERKVNEIWDIKDMQRMTKSVAVVESAQEKPLEQIMFGDLNLDAQGLASASNTFVITEGDWGKVLKNIDGKFPLIDMIVPVS